MKIITLMEPWATLMVLGYKRVETRSWNSHYRGEVAIHAGKSTKFAKELDYVQNLFAKAGIPMPEGFPTAPPEYPLGRIIAVGNLVDVKRMVPDVISVQTRMERAFGEWNQKRFAFFFEKVRRTTEQIPWEGALGLRELPRYMAAKVSA